VDVGLSAVLTDEYVFNGSLNSGVMVKPVPSWMEMVGDMALELVDAG
jgi:hypothetical protein